MISQVVEEAIEVRHSSHRLVVALDRARGVDQGVARGHGVVAPVVDGVAGVSSVGAVADRESVRAVGADVRDDVVRELDAGHVGGGIYDLGNRGDAFKAPTPLIYL